MQTKPVTYSRNPQANGDEASNYRNVLLAAGAGVAEWSPDVEATSFQGCVAEETGAAQLLPELLAARRLEKRHPYDGLLYLLDACVHLLRHRALLLIRRPRRHDKRQQVQHCQLELLVPRRRISHFYGF
uniref:Uncharacterized protein n=1 Tax=Setaria italica TaxID=4555 RepID=K3YAS8_SETIT